MRTVDGETSRPERSTSALEPTGRPVATYSSTTRRRISRLRWLSSISLPSYGRRPRPRPARLASGEPALRSPESAAPASGEQLDRDGPAEQAPAPGQAHAALEALDEPPGDEALERRGVDDVRAPSTANGSSSRRPSISRSTPRVSPIEPLELARRLLAPPERRHVPPHRREVPPPDAAERRDRAHADPEVVGAAPDGQVVLCAEVAARGRCGRSSPSRTSGTRRRSASRRRARRSAPSPPPDGGARRRARA